MVEKRWGTWVNAMVISGRLHLSVYCLQSHIWTSFMSWNFLTSHLGLSSPSLLQSHPKGLNLLMSSSLSLLRQGVLLLIFASITVFTGNTSTFAPLHNTYQFLKSLPLQVQIPYGWRRFWKHILSSKLEFIFSPGDFILRAMDLWNILSRGNTGAFGILRIIPAVKRKWIRRRARLQMGTVSWDTIAIIQDLLRVWDIVVIREEQRNQGSWLYSMEECGSENWASIRLGLVRELRATCSGGKHFRPMPTLPLPYSSLSFWLLRRIPKDANNSKALWASFFQ